MEESEDRISELSELQRYNHLSQQQWQNHPQRHELHSNKFVQRSYEFKLGEDQMTQISLGYENNFVALIYAYDQNNSQYSSFISIYSPQGQLLNRFRLMEDSSRIINKFWMLRNDEIIFPCHRLGQIVIISLRNYHRKQIIQFQAIKKGKVDIHTFPQSNLFCIVLIQQTDKVCNLTVRYYQYQGVVKQSQLILQFTDKYHHYYITGSRKIDDSSKIVWELSVKQRSVHKRKDQTCFLSFDQQRRPIVETIPMEDRPYHNLSNSRRLKLLWEVRKSNFIAQIYDIQQEIEKLQIGMVARTKDRWNNDRWKILQPQGLVDYYDVKKQLDQICSYQNQQQQDFDAIFKQLVAEASLIDFKVASGRYAFFGVGPFGDNQLLQYQVYDCQKLLQVIWQQQWGNNTIENNLYFDVGWNTNIMLKVNNRRGQDWGEYHSEQYYVTLIHTLLDSSARPQDYFMFFLLGVNEDFDDDLLMDAVEMMIEE